LRDLPAEAGRDVRRAELLGVDVLRQPALQGVLVPVREFLQPDLEALVALAPERLAAPLDDGVALPDRVRLIADGRDRRGLGRRERHLGAALEVDAEVQAA